MSRARPRMFAALAAIGMLTLGGPATTVAADPVDGVAAALLVPEDMPDGLLPLGIEDATEFDIDFPSYDANGGLEKANQKWNRDALDGTERVAVAIDFRMLFPDAAAAQAYLDEAEEILSESVSGLTPQPETPLVGEVVRRYAGTIEGSGISAEVQNFLIRQGPVVSKLYVLGFGTTLEDALPMAQAAADRTATWLASVPAGSPVGSPVASVDPLASAGQAGTELRQWATDATASSAYAPSNFSALQATGAPTITAYQDDPKAWAPLKSDGSTDWLELTYAQEVVPAAVRIVETYGNGAVVLVEAFDETSDAWVELWTGDDPTTDAVAVFSPKLRPVTFATDRLRITLGDIVPGWSEIDAVELVGTVP